MLSILLTVSSLVSIVFAESNIDLLGFASGTTTGYEMVGPSAGAHAGTYLFGAGDFNTDGLNDVVFSAADAGITNRASCGIVYVVFGSKTYSSTYLNLANFQSGSSGFRVFGVGAGDLLGSVVGGGEDFNGDGISDILLGSKNADPDGVTDAGTVWVLFGHSNSIAFVDIDLAAGLSTSLGFRIRGASAGNNLCMCAFIGDMNGDGFSDIVIGAGGVTTITNKEGTAYVIFGKSSATDINVGTYTFGTNLGFKFTGSVNNGQLGTFLGTTGDYNGDGYADVVIGFYGPSYVYVVFGHSAATNFANIAQGSWAASATTGFRVTVSSATDSYLRPLSTAGDINGDGMDDLVFTCDGLTNGWGLTFVIFGRSSGSFVDITVPAALTPTTGFSVTGAIFGDYAFGLIGGDLNNDGYLDLAISANAATALGRAYAGVGYIVYGHSSATPFSNINLATFTTSESTGYKIYGAAADDNGSQCPRFARLGDVNGDGVDDVAFAAKNADCFTGAADCGKVYILLSANRYPTSQPSSQPSRQPSRQPTSQPSRQPTRQPFGRPSAQPSAQPFTQPSAQPSTQPSINADTLQTIRTSPTYKVRNGFAFAVVTAGGKGLSWGEAAYGGDSSAVLSALQSGVTAIVGSRFSFAAIKTDHTLQLWGAEVSFDGPAVLRNGTYQVNSLIANEAAFAGIDTATRRVVAVGSKHHGGNVLDDAYCNGNSALLSFGVRSIAASSAAFAAIKADGTLLSWGNQFAGADASADFLATLSGATMVVATTAAFAVLLPDNRVAAWGDVWVGGDTTAVADQLKEVHHLVASRSCFAAFKKDSSLVVWGFEDYCGDTSAVNAALASHVVYVAHTATAMAVIKADGTVAAWGAADGGGDASAAQSNLHNIVRIYGNSKAFAALTATGGVVTWGRASYGGNIPAGKQAAVSSGVVSVYHTNRAFAALKSSGALIVWGQACHGGEPGAAVEALLTSDVHTACANDVAFSAIKTDGSVVVWGHSTAAAVQGMLFTSTSLTQPATCA